MFKIKTLVDFTLLEIRALGGNESPWAKYYEPLKLFKRLKLPIHVIDGEGLLVRPNEETKRLLRFIGCDMLCLVE